MSSASIETGSNSKRHVGDYLLTGVVAMLLINALQRLIGLGRGLGFCHFLNEDQLGSWALVNSFFVLGVPLTLLGLPGSFSKYVEYYRARNQLGDFLRTVLPVTGVGLSAALAWLLLTPDSFCWLVFHQQHPYSIVAWCGVALVALVAYSIVYELVGSLRHVRVIAIMQFIQSVVFAVLGLGLISITESWTSLLPAYAAACCAALLPGLWVVRRHHSVELESREELDRSQMWARIVPFAVALWVMNLLSNLFEVSDRYMLLHLTVGGPEIGQAAVGQYHCGRIFPNLMVSVSLMLGGVLLPYLSADWEAGNRTRIASRVRYLVQATSFGFIGLSAAALTAAPLLFDYGFGGRYAVAEAILPLALLQASWAGLFLVAEPYMLCAEKGKELAAVLVVGLGVNLLLNWNWIQAFGLPGAVTATATAGLFTLMLLLWRMSVAGCSLGWGTVAMCIAPLSIAAGPEAAAGMLFAMVLVAGRTNWLLDDHDRNEIDSAILPKMQKIGLRCRSLWPNDTM